MKCCRKNCNEDGYYKVGTTKQTAYYCKKHGKLRRMVSNANRKYKNTFGTLTINSLEDLFDKCFSNTSCLYCQQCSKRLKLIGNNNDALSLQHARNGNLYFWCKKCNNVDKGECVNRFYIRSNKKYCPLCRKIKLLEYFSKGKGKGGTHSYCKKCQKNYDSRR